MRSWRIICGVAYDKFGTHERWIRRFNGQTWGKETTLKNMAWMGG
jgi:hypothetical protein